MPDLPRDVFQTIMDRLDSIIANGLTVIGFSPGSMHLSSDSQVLADNATIVLPTAISGLIEIWNEDYSAHGKFFINADGTVERQSGNAVASESDGFLCLYQVGTGAVIKNMLGSEQTIKYFLTY